MSKKEKLNNKQVKENSDKNNKKAKKNQAQLILKQ